MKKFLCFICSFILFANAIDAQPFDESKLEGDWTVCSLTGQLPFGISGFSSIYFGESYENQDMDGFYYPCSGLIFGIRRVDESKGPDWLDDDETRILDFFICNDDKLHVIIGDHFSIHFTITVLTDSHLSLKTTQGAVIELTKSDAADIPVSSNTSSQSSDIYNLNGVKLRNIVHDGVYIVNGEKRLIKQPYIPCE